MKNEFKGFSLFFDIEDYELRHRNQATIMANIFEMNLNEKNKLNGRGFALVKGYFDSIPEDERKFVHDRFMSTMKERGYATKTN